MPPDAEDVELPVPRDAGLARERTELAWNRSGLAVLVAVAVLLRRLWPLEGYRTALAVGFIAVGAVAWAVGMQLARRRPAPGGGTLTDTACRALTVGTLALAVAGFVLAFYA